MLGRLLERMEQRQREHEAAHVAEAHALLAGQVYPKAIEQVLEGLDRAGDDLLAGDGAVLGDPRPVDVEDVERRGMVDVFRGDEDWRPIPEMGEVRYLVDQIALAVDDHK